MRNILLVALIMLITITTPIHTPKLPTPLKLVPYIVKRPIGSLEVFMHRIGRVEGGTYETVGGYKKKYLGLYQFHPATLRSLGITADASEFLHNPALQDSAMVLYLKDNAKDLKHVIQKYNNTYFNGILVTKSGILAGAHLVGSAGVLAFFYPDKYHYRTSDGNGMQVATYMEKFANYNLRGF